MRRAILGGVFLALAGCSDTTALLPDNDLMVIEAFLFTGRPVDEVRIFRTIPLGSTDTIPTPVNDAVVTLSRGTTTWTLVSINAEGGYGYSGIDLVIAPGDTFRLAVTWNGDVASGETVVPVGPTGAASARDTILTPNRPQPGQGRPRGGLRPDALETTLVTWNNPEHLLHFVVTQSLDSNAVTILPDGFGGPARRLFRLISLPTTDDFREVTVRELQAIGPHRIYVYRVNEEYAQLYQSRNQDSRDLNEPLTNIVGGLGVFSAFTADSVALEVVRR